MSRNPRRCPACSDMCPMSCAETNHPHVVRCGRCGCRYSTRPITVDVVLQVVNVNRWQIDATADENLRPFDFTVKSSNARGAASAPDVYRVHGWYDATTKCIVQEG